MAEAAKGGLGFGRAAMLVALAAGAIAIYVSLDAGGNQADAACAASAAKAAALDPHIFGQVAAFRPVTESADLSDVAFTGADGTEFTIADFAGKTVLLNVWAVWCEPCKAEMPALDRLAVAIGSDSFAVVPINVDTINTPERPAAFLAEEIRPQALQLYLDRKAAVLPLLRDLGLAGYVPTTILIDDNGCELGVMQAPAEWDAPEAQALITAAIDA